MNLVRLVGEETNRALLTTNGRIIDMGVVIEAVVVVGAAEAEEEVRVSREDLLLLVGQDRHVGGEDGGILLLPLHHLRLPELVVQATGVEVIQDDFATCQNDWNMTVVEEFRLREAQRGEALPMLLLLLLLSIVKVVEEGETKKEKHKLFRFVTVGPLLLLLLSLEGDEVKYWMDGVNWAGLGWGRGQIIIYENCVCSLPT